MIEKKKKVEKQKIMQSSMFSYVELFCNETINKIVIPEEKMCRKIVK